MFVPRSEETTTVSFLLLCPIFKHNFALFITGQLDVELGDLFIPKVLVVNHLQVLALETSHLLSIVNSLPPSLPSLLP